MSRCRLFKAVQDTLPKIKGNCIPEQESSKTSELIAIENNLEVKIEHGEFSLREGSIATPISECGETEREENIIELRM